MPFYLSLKPQNTEIQLPENQYEKMYDAEAKGYEILQNCKGLHFVAIFFKDEHTPPRLITNLIQKGFKLYSWTQFKMFDKSNRIDTFFVLNGEHYIKLKPFNDKLTSNKRYY
jgi:hypothetical protein